jgi:inorganic pyrophosphatase
MDESAFPGCVIESRLIGVIEGEQDQDGAKQSKDRLVAIPSENHRHSDLKDLANLNAALVRELGQFFVNYQQQQGCAFKVLGVKGPKQAARCWKRDQERKKRVTGNDPLS